MIGASRLFATLLCLAWIGVSSCPAWAHEDPWGDIHPWVTVVNGQFHVVFRANGIDAPQVKHQFRVIYSPEGKVMVPRHRLTDEETGKSYPELTLRRAEDRGGVPRIDQVFPDAKPCGSSRDGRRLLEVVDKVEGVEKQTPLPLDTSTMADLTDYWVNATHAAVLWNKMEKVDPNPENSHFTLCLTWFRRGDFSEPVTKTLGEPCAIYDFAVASNLVWARGRIWVAWMQVNRKTNAVDAVLSSYDPVTGALETKKMNGFGAWNSSVSLATTGGWLCAAWHSTADGAYPGTAQIITVFERLPEQTPAKP